MDKVLGKTKQQMKSSLIAIFVLPVLLVHGYGEDSSVWNLWKSWLTSDSFKHIYIATFKDAQCGNVGDHAAELSQIVNRILHDTGSKRLNIVAHSKGGLDARWYISSLPYTRIDRVSNLVMIATPNLGTEAAYMDLTHCAFEGSAGLDDLRPESQATRVTDRTATHYYTIAGNYSSPCFFVIERSICYLVPNDGLVTVDSAKANYPLLGVFNYNHSELLTHKDVYQKLLPIIRRN